MRNRFLLGIVFLAAASDRPDGASIPIITDVRMCDDPATALVGSNPPIIIPTTLCRSFGMDQQRGIMMRLREFDAATPPGGPTVAEQHYRRRYYCQTGAWILFADFLTESVSKFDPNDKSRGTFKVSTHDNVYYEAQQRWVLDANGNTVPKTSLKRHTAPTPGTARLCPRCKRPFNRSA